ncbi:ferritin-like domain-containing protein [Herbaspirillum sp. RV1423]|uniref:ferritin-like domain-containing protein n=1 Tax=Herbaspirillum sp. RV1423 TaxID=1443993 RepID=UPI0004B473EF|nr:ferritin-like domain-containing protein [Herbaspirillum sp. RV1423]
MASPEQYQPRWRIADLDFSRIDLQRVRDDEYTFYLVACASFVESGSDLYTHNLVDFFHDNEQVVAWLRGQWELEELQHGAALRAYVAHVWPEFDWQSAYDSFLGEYAAYCKVELLEPTKALEMAARCVVETGTATYYRALSRSTKEPMLRDLAARISNDEVNHYKHFYHYFRQYREREGVGRSRVLATLSRRTLEMRNEDADCAIRHVLRFRDPARAEDAAYLRQLSARMNTIVRTNLTPEMALRMIMRPLELPPKVQSWVQYPIRQLMHYVFLR